MKSILEYVELTPRVRGRKSFLLVKKDYDAMLSAENLTAAFRRLETTQYAKFESKHATEFDLGKAEEELTQTYQAEVDFILSKLKNKAAINFFLEMHRSIELRNISSILKAIILDIGWEKASQFIFPYGKIDLSKCKTLIEAKNIGNVLKLFTFRERLLIEEINRIMKETEDPSRKDFEIGVIIYKYTYGALWSKLADLDGKDKESIRLVGIDMDILNIMTVLRAKKLQFKPEEIERFLVPYSFRLTETEVKRAIGAQTDKEVIKIFVGGKYVNIISPLISIYEAKDDLSLFETALKRYHAWECRRAFYSIFHLGEALAYLYLRWYEFRDLIAILVGKYFGLPGEKIESSLILHQPLHPI